MPTPSLAPAANNNAGDAGDAATLVVFTFCDIVRSPVSVSTEILSVESRPLYVAPLIVTEPIFNAPAFTTDNAPKALPEAIVDSALEALVKVIALEPTKTKPKSFVSLTAPVRMSAPVSLPIEDALASVILPVCVAAVLLEFVRTPNPLTPVPLIVRTPVVVSV